MMFCVLAVLAACCTLVLVPAIACICVVHAVSRWRRLVPTLETLREDLGRLGRIFRLEDFEKREFGFDVVAYYAATTFRDYALLELATGCDAMHTELVPPLPLPYPLCGQLKQLLYVVAHLGEGGRRGKVLEVGHGKGSNCIFLASLFPGVRFVGVDPVPEHVHHARAGAARAGLTNAEFVLADAADELARDLGAHGRSFDLIFGIESLCYADTDRRVGSFLAAAARALRPGGKLVIVDGFRRTPCPCATSFAGAVDACRAMMLAEAGFRTRRMTSKAAWTAAAAGAGFELVDDVDLTAEALGFWVRGWKVAHLLLAWAPALVRLVAASETGANFVAVAMTAHALALGSAEYGVLAFVRSD